jgi:predicted CoA-substrate-specific enzyme activase
MQLFLSWSALKKHFRSFILRFFLGGSLPPFFVVLYKEAAISCFNTKDLSYRNYQIDSHRDVLQNKRDSITCHLISASFINMYSVGIDIGSVATKSVVYNGGISGSVVIPTGWSPRESSREALVRVLQQSGIARDSIKSIVVTGYGRGLADFADQSVTEITCHARGALFLNQNIRTVLDIGGQDSKVISLDASGSVTDCVMNDKCAAGTGRFLEVMARLLGGEVQDLDRMATGAEAQMITSMCTVFAESEVISLLAKGVSKESIARGILASIASRSVSLLERVSIEPQIAFTGGVSKSAVLKDLMEQKTGARLLVSPLAQITGALGAALIGWNALQRRSPGISTYYGFPLSRLCRNVIAKE